MAEHDPIAGSRNRKRVFAGFALTETSYRAGSFLPPHSHSSAVLSFAIAGGTNVSFGRSAEWCDGDAILFLPPGVSHANAYPAASTRIHIELTEATVDRAPGALRNAIAQELRRAAVAAFKEPDNLTEFDLAISISDVIGILGSLRKTARSMRPEHWLLRLRDYLHAHCAEPLSLSVVSSISGHHPVHISREFRACFGKTISDYVRQQRIVRAAGLLRRGSMTLSEIALDCGFYDQSHFTNAFRRTTGASPSAFRSRSR